MLIFLATPHNLRVSMVFLDFFSTLIPHCMTNPKFPRNMNDTDVYVKFAVECTQFLC